MVIFSKDNINEEITFKPIYNSRDTLYVLIIGAIPINEPIVRYGPFVMNTREEIYQSIRDY